MSVFSNQKNTTPSSDLTSKNSHTNIPPILYEDTDVLVINKPAGLLTHAIMSSNEISVASLFANKIQDNDGLRAGVVHRLDKDTSGVMILAKTTSAKQFLQQQFQQRTVDKYYYALVEGMLKPEQARLELPLKRSKSQPQKMLVHSTGKKAVSEYKVIQYYQQYSYLDVHILTGRTHQIRTQFAYLGHPVVHDPLYGHAISSGLLKRQFLHAYSLTITLPLGDRKTFHASLSQDLDQFLLSLS